MKLVSVVHYYPPHIGGMEIVAQQQAESLAGFGHESVVVTLAARGEAAGETTINQTKVIRARAWNVMDARFGIPFPLIGLGAVRALRRQIKSADAVHIHDVFYLTSLVAYGWAKRYHKPIFVTQHVAMVEHPSPVVRAAERLMYRLSGDRLFRAAHKIFVYNAGVQQFLEGRGVAATKIKELRNGIDTASFRPAEPGEKTELRQKYGLPVDQPLVLFVGRFVPKKGYQVVYEAASPDYDLVFVGSGQFSLPPKPGVHLLGGRSQAELAEIYRACDIFAFPAVGEMLTLCLQEAMASGLPIITTNEPAYAGYDLDHSLMKFVAPEPVGLKAAITEILGSPDLAAAMGRYSREVAEERFDWKRNVANLITGYDEVLKKPLVVTTSWDDGHKLDLRLAELLKTYRLKGTFYVAPGNREFATEQLLSFDEVRKLGREFEVGAHTLTHPSLPDLADDQARREIGESGKFLTALTGQPVKCFCYPKGQYLPKHVQMVESSGYTYSRTVNRFYFGDDTATALEAPTTVHTYNHWTDLWRIACFAHFNPRRIWRYRSWDNLAIAMFDHALDQRGVFHLWGHSWEIEQHGDWRRLQRVLEHISGRDNVTYLANGEL